MVASTRGACECESIAVSSPSPRLSVDKRQLRARARPFDVVVANGDTDCQRLAPGYRFEVARHPVVEHNQQYVVTSVQCNGINPAFCDGKLSEVYVCSYACVPLRVNPLPPRPRPAPRLGLEVAQVVGPANQDIFVDELGRVKL